YYKDMPEDVWLLSPSYEKDQSAIIDAQREIEDFRKKFPTSPYMDKANDIRREVLKRLVDHEVYVARFYLKSDHPKAAAMRIEGAIRRYPGSGREPELLFSLGETYLQMCDPQRAKETFARVVAEHGKRLRLAARSSTSSTSRSATARSRAARHRRRHRRLP